MCLSVTQCLPQTEVVLVLSLICSFCSVWEYLPFWRIPCVVIPSPLKEGSTCVVILSSIAETIQEGQYGRQPEEISAQSTLGQNKTNSNMYVFQVAQPIVISGILLFSAIFVFGQRQSEGQDNTVYSIGLQVGLRCSVKHNAFFVLQKKSYSFCLFSDI